MRVSNKESAYTDIHVHAVPRNGKIQAHCWHCLPWLPSDPVRTGQGRRLRGLILKYWQDIFLVHRFIPTDAMPLKPLNAAQNRAQF